MPSKNPISYLKTGKTIAKVLISFVTLGYCFSLIDLTALGKAVTTANLYLLTVALLVTFMGGIVCKSVLIWQLLNINNRVSLIKIITINLGLRFYTVFLPRGVVTGLRWHRYRKLSDNYTSLTLLSLEAILTLLLLATGSIFFYMIGDTKVPKTILIMLIATPLILSVLLAMTLSANLRKKLYSSMNIENSTAITKPIKHFFISYIDSLKNINFNNPKNFSLALTSSFISYLLFIIGAYITAQAMMLDISFIEIAWARSAILILAHLPISIAGIGVRELGFISLFGFAGLSSEQALSYAIVSFGIQLIIAFFGAIIETDRWFLNKREY